MECKNCGQELKGDEKTKGFCKYSCYENWIKWNKTPNCKCPICGKEFYLKPSRIKSCKNGVTCSRECAGKLKSIYSRGEGNHQYGLKGELNSSFKGHEITHKNHNVVDIYVYCPGHPYANECNRVVKHRLVVEQNHTLFNSNCFNEINGKFYLKKEYQVHHKDGDHNNNDVSNLEVLTRSEHTTIHNLEKEIIRDPINGRITGVVKRGELLENPNIEDNQQPSFNRNINEGSETNNRILTDNAEDSNIDTSALPSNTSDDIVRTV